MGKEGRGRREKGKEGRKRERSRKKESGERGRKKKQRRKEGGRNYFQFHF